MSRNQRCHVPDPNEPAGVPPPGPSPMPRPAPAPPPVEDPPVPGRPEVPVYTPPTGRVAGTPVAESVCVIAP